jgi:hypothetical protein
MHKLEASKNESKEYKEFKNRYKKAIIFWVLLLVIGTLIYLILGSKSAFEKNIGLAIIGTGGLSLIFSLLLATGMANYHEPSPVVFSFEDILS